MGDLDDGFYGDGVDLTEHSDFNFDDEPTKPRLWGGGFVPNEKQVYSILTQYLGDPVFARRFIDCMNIMRVKNVDYSQNEQKGDRIAAFKRIARDVGITTRQAWAALSQKHWGAVMRYVKDGYVESEPIDGRINDLINYLVLFGAIVDDERKP